MCVFLTNMRGKHISTCTQVKLHMDKHVCFLTNMRGKHISICTQVAHGQWTTMRDKHASILYTCVAENGHTYVSSKICMCVVNVYLVRCLHTDTHAWFQNRTCETRFLYMFVQKRCMFAIIYLNLKEIMHGVFECWCLSAGI
jgi:hypothetical protein